MVYIAWLDFVEVRWDGRSLFSIVILVAVILVLRETLKPIDRRWRFALKRSRRLPPGPVGRPVVGNLYQMFQARDRGEFGKYVGLHDQSMMVSTD